MTTCLDCVNWCPIQAVQRGTALVLFGQCVEHDRLSEDGDICEAWESEDSFIYEAAVGTLTPNTQHKEG